MEWIEQNIDDSLFESMLTPLTKQILERIFLGDPGSPENQSGIFVFHREIGLILQNAGSKALLPKAVMGSSWEMIRATLEGCVESPDRARFRGLGTSPDPQDPDQFPLLPNRIGEAKTLLFWTYPRSWGRIVFLRTGEGKEWADPLLEQLRKRTAEIGPFVVPMVDDWMLDSILEVFWSRIMVDIPVEYQPMPWEESPEWVRCVPVLSAPGPQEEGKNFLSGRYVNGLLDGWRRSVDISPNSGEGAPPLPESGEAFSQSRTFLEKNGKSLSIPVNLWGLFDLGTVRIPAALIKKTSGATLLRRLRKSRVMALRSLYRHLLYEGKLESLSFWRPESESFDTKVLENAEEWFGKDVLDDTVLEIHLESAGFKKRIEECLRPTDLLTCDGKRPDRLAILLRRCSREIAGNNVIPRLLRVEGLSEGQIAAPVSLGDFLATKPS